MKVSGTVTTVSPARTPAAMSAKRNASVPLAIPTQNDCLAELREVALELPHHRTTDEAGGVERRLEHRAQLVAQLPVHGDEIEERNLMRAHRLTVLAVCRWQSRRSLATSRERLPWP